MKLSHYCVTIALLAILFFVGCTDLPNSDDPNSTNPLIGMWSVTVTEEGVSSTTTLAFASDGTVTISQTEFPDVEGTYTYTETQITIIGGGMNMVYDYTVSGDMLCITALIETTPTCHTKQ